MSNPTYPSPDLRHRRADMAVHGVGFAMIMIAGGALITKAAGSVGPALIGAVVVYVLCALMSNLASVAYHFAPWHDRRKLMRRIDHGAIYLSISGSFTPFFVLAGTTWTFALIWICWGLTGAAIWKKLVDQRVKSPWSTASYLGLGAIGLSALPDLTNVPVATPWCILGGALCYVIGTAFYVRKSMPYRYSIWHSWVNFGAVLMFAGIWIALFQ